MLFVAAGVALVLLVLWLGWYQRASVDVFLTSSRARLQPAVSDHLITTRSGGQIEAVSIKLGDTVTAGQLLISIDAEAARDERDAAAERATRVAAQILAVQGEIAAARSVGLNIRQVSAAAAVEREVRLEAAKAAVRLAEADMIRAVALFAKDAIAWGDLDHKRAETERVRVAARRLEEGQNLARAEEGMRGRLHETRLAELQRQASDLGAMLDSSKRTANRLSADLENRSIRAPFAGRITELKTQGAGSLVQGGQHLATLGPGGPLRVTAEFSSATALGRVKPGQSARMRLDGFPWQQYGTIPLRVETVSDEMSEGHIRVELALSATGPPSIGLQRGLSGEVDVLVETVTPREVLLRAMGRPALARVVDPGDAHRDREPR